jgi:hypothetical protein
MCRREIDFRLQKSVQFYGSAATATKTARKMKPQVRWRGRDARTEIDFRLRKSAQTYGSEAVGLDRSKADRLGRGSCGLAGAGRRTAHRDWQEDAGIIIINPVPAQAVGMILELLEDLPPCRLAAKPTPIRYAPDALLVC